MAAKKDNKKDSKNKFWWIYDQEETPIAVGYAKTKGGAFKNFEEETGLSREGFSACEAVFTGGCSVARVPNA